MNTDLILFAKDIKREYYHPEKVSVLKGISLGIYAGETLAIVGASGSGKSTLLHILGTLEKPTSGELFFHGKSIDVSMLSQIRNQHFGFIFQSGNLLEEYTLLENILIKARIGKRPIHKGSEAFEEATSLLALVGLSHRLNFPVKYLSGGEKQRAAIARALMNNPNLILADEPTGNLDELSSKNVEEILISCCKELKKSLILVTHNHHFANLCDRTMQLADGVLVDEYANI